MQAVAGQHCSILVAGKTEAEWTEELAKKVFGEMAITSGTMMGDRSRADILTPKLAIEVDYARKWAEAIGQSLWYAMSSNRQAAVLLLVENAERDKIFVARCVGTCAAAGIKFYWAKIG